MQQIGFATGSAFPMKIVSVPKLRKMSFEESCCTLLMHSGTTAVFDSFTAVKICNHLSMELGSVFSKDE